MEPTKPWRNRIVGYGEANPSTLVEHPKNWRAHPENQSKTLSSVLDKVGIVDPVIIQQDTGVIVDGHLRVSMAIEAGIKNIPVQYVDLSDAEVDYTLATFDPIGALATTDLYHLTNLVDELDTPGEAVDTMLNNLIAEPEDEERDYEPSYEPEFERSRFSASDIDAAGEKMDRRINQDREQTKLECPQCHRHFYVN